VTDQALNALRNFTKTTTASSLSFCALALWLGASPVSSAQTPAPLGSGRVIRADLKSAQTPLSRVYQACVGAGRANEGLRADWQQQLKVCKDEIGFQAIRFHGLLHDDMGVYREGKDGTPIYNWQYIDALYDYLLSIGVRPFVEISFMPHDLASGTQTVFWWKSNVTPPKDYGKWQKLITALVNHWTERYGEDEVKKWNFEIWNEPDCLGFFGPKVEANRQAEYFELFAKTTAAIKAANPAYKVGGPAGCSPRWILPLIKYCSEKNVPLDFISFHSYGLGGGPSGLDIYGEKKRYLSDDLQAVVHYVQKETAEVRKSEKPNLPVDITEWSTSYNARDAVHDSYFSAPYILEQLRSTEAASCMSYWTFTDVFEEMGPAPRAFHGGFGLINLEGIKKASFFAYKFLNQLAPNEVKSSDRESYVTEDGNGNVAVLFWNLTNIKPNGVSDQDFFQKPQPAADKGDTVVSLSNCPPGSYHMTVYRVGWNKNDAYSRYLDWGSPSQLTIKQVADLKALATGAPDSESDIGVGSDGKFEQHFPTRANDVFFITLHRK
jgi:xylan 1,4-beta-xylosidase